MTFDVKIMVMRLTPITLKGLKISGYLETFYLPTSIPDVIESIGTKYGGGKYQIRIVDTAGKHVKSKTFEISGAPKLSEERDGVISEVVENFIEKGTDLPSYDELQAFWASLPMPSSNEIKGIVTKHALSLLDNDCPNPVEVMKFLKDLYAL